jgi:hypothetical protein
MASFFGLFGYLSGMYFFRVTLLKKEGLTGLTQFNAGITYYSKSDN